MNILLKTTLRQSRARPLSTLLMVLGIALGVAGVVAMDIARTSVSKSFDLSTAALVSRTSHQILGNDFTVPQSVFTRLRTHWGINASTPVISANVQIPELGSQTLTLLGMDPFSQSQFNQDFGPAQLGEGSDTTAFFPRSRGLLLGPDILPEKTMGDPIPLSLGKRTLSVPLAGRLTAQGPETRQILSGLILADIALAQEILALGERITRIDLALPPDNPELVKALAQDLPQGCFLIPTAERNQSVRNLSRAFEGSLSAFSMLALFMGIFLIYNTVSFSVARQRKRHGTLRALGATRGEIFRAVMAEVALLALVGSLLGLILGILLGRGAVQAVCATVSEIYYPLTVTRTAIAPATLVKGLLAGILAALGAGFFPALSAAKTRPITLIQTSAPEQQLARILPRLFLAGLGVLGISGLVFAGFRDRPGMDFVGIFLGFAGASLMAPALVRLILNRLFIPLVPKLPGLKTSGRAVVIKMAAGNISRGLSRTGVLIASLMVVTSVYIGIDIMTLSFRASVDQWVDGHIGGDIHVASADPRQPGLPRDLAAKIRALPQVDDLSDYTMLRLFSRVSGEVHLFSYITDKAVKQWTWTRPTPPGLTRDQDMERRLNQGEIWVSEIFARRNPMVERDGVVTTLLETDNGSRAFPVAGIFRDYFMGGGRVVVSRKTLANHWGDRAVTAIQVFTSQGIRDEALVQTQKAIQSLVPRDRLFKVRLGREMKTEILAAFDRTFAITTALQFLTALVALTGILNAVTALLMERTREMGILRACGAQPGQVGKLVLAECSLAGALSGLLAMPLGWALAEVLIQVVNHRSFGWTYEMAAGPGPLIQALVLATSAAALAGIFPAFRAARTHIPNALHME